MLSTACELAPTNYGEVFRSLPTPVLLVATGKDPIFSANRKQKVYSNSLNSLFLTKGETTLGADDELRYRTISLEN